MLQNYEISERNTKDIGFYLCYPPPLISVLLSDKQLGTVDEHYIA